MRIRLKLDQLQELMAARRLSQNHWAIKLGLSRGHWSDIVNGRHPYPSNRTRERMLEAFGVEFDALFTVEAGPDLPDHEIQKEMQARYLIDRQLGQGGMGTVYLARDLRLGRSVALKVVAAEAVGGVSIEQFLREISNAARVEHPNILPLLDAGVVAGCPWYVMPFIRDGSLRESLTARGALDPATAIPLIRGLAEALNAAHAERVLHCDVKPANILLSGSHPYLADFGIARTLRSDVEWPASAELGSSAGTPAYVSPEQALGESALDARSDVYSLACVAFEMLSGRPPFEGPTTVATISRRFSGDVPRLDRLAPHVPAAIADAVARAMTLDREHRTATAREFAVELESAEHGRASVLAGVRRRLAVAVTPRHPTSPGTRRTPMRRFEQLRQDVAYGLRTLRRAPAYATTVVVTLGLAIAANLSAFGVANPFFLRPLPFADPDRLVQIEQANVRTGADRMRFSLPQYVELRSGNRAFEDLASYSYRNINLVGSEGPEVITAGIVSANLFSLLGTPAMLGRTLRPGEDGPGAPALAVISHGLWQRRFGSDRELIGRTIMLDGRALTVAGVMPAEFVFPFGGTDVWMAWTSDPVAASRTATSHLVVGRMRDGWSPERSREELRALRVAMADRHPETDADLRDISVLPLRRALNFAWEPLVGVFTLLGAASLLLLLVACVNVASLALARASTRGSEMVVRSALGAGRGRLVRQLLTESSLLAVAGGLLGLAIAVPAAGFMAGMIPPDLYRVGDATLDIRVAAMAVACTVVAALAFGMAPALAATRRDIAAVLREGSAGSGWGVRSVTVRQLLVTTQIVAGVALASVAGLMVRSHGAARQTELGFDAGRVLVVTATPPAGSYPDAASAAAYHDRARDAVAALGPVQAVASAQYLPLNNETQGISYSRPDQRPAPGTVWPEARLNGVSPGYFAAMGIPLLAGGDFTGFETPDDAAAVVVSRALADRLWPDGDAVGAPLLIGSETDPRTATVIAVAGNVLHDELTVRDAPQIYRSLSQVPARRRFMVVRTAREPASISGDVRVAIGSVDPLLPVSIRTMSSVVDEKLLQFSAPAGMLTVLAGVSLALALLGVYGVISFSLAQRSREMGIRLALGANSARLLRTVMASGARMALAGVIGGIALAFGLGRLMASLLFGVRASDPVVLAGVGLLFGGLALLSCLVPALRVTRINPSQVLRQS